MRGLRHQITDGQGADIFRRHGLIARQAAMFWRHLSRAVYEAPGRIGEQGVKFPPAHCRRQVDDGAMPLVRHLDRPLS